MCCSSGGGVRLLLSIFASFAFFVNLNGQGLAEGYLYVYPQVATCYPVGSSALTTNPTLNNLFSTFQVVAYKQSFPGAKTPGLDNAYEIHLNGDLNDFADSLENTGLFSLIELAEYYQTLGNGAADMKAVDATLSDCNDCPTPLAINDPWGLQSWDVTVNGYSCAWTITEGDPNVTVAIADTEFDETHPDLNGKITQYGDDSNVAPGCYHGTSVSGMAGARVNNGLFTAGVGNKISLAGFVVSGAKVSGSSCSGNPFPSTWNAYLEGYKIINISWSGAGYIENIDNPPSSVVAAIREMTENNVLLVYAAGPNKEGQNNTTKYHNGYNQIPGVVIVTAHQHNTYAPMAEPHYAAVDLSAPGRSDTQPLYGIQPSWHDTGLGPGIGTRDGTSTAAPIVAGTAGLMLSVNPCLTNIEIEAILKATAKPNVNYDPATMGAGYLCAYDAVAAAADLLSPDPGDVHVYDDEVWDQPRSIGGNVIVHPFARLTIRSLVRFNSTDSKIVVNAVRWNWKTLCSPGDAITIIGMASRCLESKTPPSCRPGRIICKAGLL